MNELSSYHELKSPNPDDVLTFFFAGCEELSSVSLNTEKYFNFNNFINSFIFPFLTSERLH